MECCEVLRVQSASAALLVPAGRQHAEREPQVIELALSRVQKVGDPRGGIQAGDC
jgi:hypothetical protein